MKSIKVLKINTTMIFPLKEKVLRVYTVIKKVDHEGTQYEKIKEEAILCRVCDVLESGLYVTRLQLIESFLHEELEDLKSGVVFEHGYPEERLVPRNHKEECLEIFREDALLSIEKVMNVAIDKKR